MDSRLNIEFLKHIHVSKGLFSAWLVLFYFFAIYWLFIAKDLYISKSYLILESTDLKSSNQSFDMQSLISGQGPHNRSDQLMLVNYLKSIDSLKVIKSQLDLYSHYQSPIIDIPSKLFFDEGDGIEELQSYLEDYVDIYFDEFQQMIVIEVKSFAPEMSQEINQLLVDIGEKYINKINQGLAFSQVDFLEKELRKIKTNRTESFKALLDYKRDIKSTDELTRLQLESEFQDELYKSALGSLENARIEASRQLKKLLIIQSPNLPETNMEPKRMHQILLYSILSAILLGLVYFFRSVIKDYQT